MKGLSKIFLSILIGLFFLISGIACTQRPAKESYSKGVEHAIQGKFRKAKEEFEEALKIDPFYNPAKHSLEIIKDVIEQKIKTETAIHLFKGVSSANKGENDLAIAYYNMAIVNNPKYAEAYINRGIAYHHKGQNDLAIREYNKAIEINPKDAEAYYNRGIAYHHTDQNDLAILEYNKAIEIDPKFTKAYINRGIAYHHKGQNDLAILDYNKAIEINPNYAEAYYNRGVVYDNKGQYDLAIRDYNKAIEINQKDAEAYINRGFVYLLESGDTVKGCADLKKACELGMCGKYNLAKQKGYCL
jgi:tetratricopeptide (TPR) repeat protein